MLRKVTFWVNFWTYLDISDELNKKIDQNNNLCKTVKDQLAKLGEEVENAKKKEPVPYLFLFSQISRMNPKPESKSLTTKPLAISFLLL